MGILRTILSSVLIASALLAGCDDSERNIIFERSPFFERKFTYDPKDAPRVISAVQRFADNRGMDFLSGGATPDGDFNLTAAGPDMNFKVIHSSVIEPAQNVIWVYARTKPSTRQQQRAREFACIVDPTCAQS